MGEEVVGLVMDIVAREGKHGVVWSDLDGLSIPQ